MNDLIDEKDTSGAPGRQLFIRGMVQNFRTSAPVLLAASFFPCAIFYHELLLRAYDRDCEFFGMALARIFFFSLAAGLAIFLLLDLIPHRKVARFIGGALSFAFIVVLCVERGMKDTFGIYYGVLAAAHTAGDAIGGFSDTVAAAALDLLPFILLSFVPFLLFVVLRRRIFLDNVQAAKLRVSGIIVLIAAQLCGSALSKYGETKDVYSYDYSMNLGIPAFGLTNSIRLEFQYALFGMPEADLSSFIKEVPADSTKSAKSQESVITNRTTVAVSATGSPNTSEALPAPYSHGNTASAAENASATENVSAAENASAAENTAATGSVDAAENATTAGSDATAESAAATENTSAAENADAPVPASTAPSRVYSPNVIDSIDFDALAAGTSDKTLKSMHEYFGSLTPSMENEYTGLFAGKNLILICAESFDDYVIDPELTPTLYRMTQEEGFVFTNFYQPDWTLSTCGGEFSVTTGLIPNWIGKSDSARKSIGNAMPTTPGNLFKAAGYNVNAWHNGNYSYYSRDKYLPVFGYDYKAIGQGLKLPTRTWLASDREMIEATADEYINEYLQTGVPFHTYYMTISGHGAWHFSGNQWATNYRDLVEAKYPGLSEPCLAYLAANIELDRALKLLVEKLEAAGIADDTLIAMAADHYPYFLAMGNNNQNDSTDYYNELNRYFGRPEDSEKLTSRYRNTLLMWSASIPRTVVDAPCYSCDIVPTILNLFGIDYDSRLYTGRDILDPNYDACQYSSSMPLVIFVSNHGQGNSWITAAGTYEASQRTFTPLSGVTVPDDYVENVSNLVAGKLRTSRLIITQNYYASVFGGN